MHASTHTSLIADLVAQGTLRTPRIIEAFQAIDRADFVPAELAGIAHEDRALPIGSDQTISQPSTVAFMLELLAPEPGDRILDIGSGSGWTTALLTHIVGSQGSVLGLERVDALVETGQRNLVQRNISTARIERAGTELGAPHGDPFQRILVSAAARNFHPELVDQLTEHGVLVMPVRHAIWRVVRVEHQPVIDQYDGFVFVPLITDADEQEQ